MAIHEHTYVRLGQMQKWSFHKTAFSTAGV